MLDRFLMMGRLFFGSWSGFLESVRFSCWCRTAERRRAPAMRMPAGRFGREARQTCHSELSFLGKSTVNRVPASLAESTETVPPCAATISLTM